MFCPTHVRIFPIHVHTCMGCPCIRVWAIFLAHMSMGYLYAYRLLINLGIPWFTHMHICARTHMDQLL